MAGYALVEKLNIANSETDRKVSPKRPTSKKFSGCLTAGKWLKFFGMALVDTKYKADILYKRSDVPPSFKKRHQTKRRIDRPESSYNL